MHEEISEGVIRIMREDALQPGDRIVESKLAERLRVSRTPVRMVLDQMADKGYIRRVRNRGVELVRLPDNASERQARDAEDDLLVRISHDRNAGNLGDEINETEIMRLYDLSRSEANRILERLANYSVIERKLGYGWRFLEGIKDSQARAESYAFRLVVEPQMLLQPHFELSPQWVAEMRERHASFSEGRWQTSESVRLFEMNAAFHEGLAAASNNRYFLDTVRRQNHLRRLLNYDWAYGFERVLTVCREHMEILDRLEENDNEIASLLLYRHIENTSELRGTLNAERPD
jgi:DNA-binding GntR family transcriptional regulator